MTWTESTAVTETIAPDTRGDGIFAPSVNMRRRQERSLNSGCIWRRYVWDDESLTLHNTTSRYSYCESVAFVLSIECVPALKSCRSYNLYICRLLRLA